MFHRLVIPIVLSTDAQYAPWAATTVHSIVHHASIWYKYDICILHENLPESVQCSLKSIVSKKNNCTLHFIDAAKYMNRKVFVSCHLSRAAYYRLCIPDIFKQVDKILYLDTDVIVLDDLSKLYRTDLKKNLIGAVIDYGMYRILTGTDQVRKLRYYRKGCRAFDFNSGVLLMNLKQMRLENFTSRCFDLLDKIKKPLFHDQTILNIAARGCVHFLPEKWNTDWRYTLDKYKKTLQPLAQKWCREIFTKRKILHYLSPTKPWHCPEEKGAETFFKTALQIRSFYPEYFGTDTLYVTQKRNVRVDDGKIPVVYVCEGKDISALLQSIRTVCENNKGVVHIYVLGYGLSDAEINAIKALYADIDVLNHDFSVAAPVKPVDILMCEMPRVLDPICQAVILSPDFNAPVDLRSFFQKEIYVSNQLIVLNLSILRQNENILKFKMRYVSGIQAHQPFHQIMADFYQAITGVNMVTFMPKENTPFFSYHYVPIVFAADDAYASRLAVTIQSLIDVSSPHRNYDMFVLETKMSMANKEKLRSLIAGRNNFSIRFMNMEKMLGTHTTFFVNRHLTVSTYFRLFIPNLFPAFHKMVYLDSDLIIKRDIADFYDTDIKNYLMGVVLDRGIQKWISRAGEADLNFQLKHCTGKDFNAGVLLMNLKQMRQTGFVKKCLDKLKEIKQPYFHDQTILNLCALGQVYFMNDLWNVDAPFNWKNHFTNFEQAYIIHYVSALKPWVAPTQEQMVPFCQRVFGLSQFYSEYIGTKRPWVMPAQPGVYDEKMPLCFVLEEGDMPSFESFMTKIAFDKNTHTYIIGLNLSQNARQKINEISKRCLVTVVFCPDFETGEGLSQKDILMCELAHCWRFLPWALLPDLERTDLLTEITFTPPAFNVYQEIKDGVKIWNLKYMRETRMDFRLKMALVEAAKHHQTLNDVLQTAFVPKLYPD